MAQVSACCSWENELRLLAQIDEPPYDVTQQSAQRGPLGDTWYNHLGHIGVWKNPCQCYGSCGLYVRAICPTDLS